jgi:hypothetical protein
MLLEQHIRTLRLEQGNHEIGAVVAIRQDQIAAAMLPSSSRNKACSLPVLPE